MPSLPKSLIPNSGYRFTVQPRWNYQMIIIFNRVKIIGNRDRAICIIYIFKIAADSRMGMKPGPKKGTKSQCT